MPSAESAVAENEHVASWDRRCILAFDELPKLTIPHIVEQDDARLEIATRDESENVLIRLHSCLSLGNERTQVSQADMMQRLSIDAVQRQVALRDVFAMLATFKDVSRLGGVLRCPRDL